MPFSRAISRVSLVAILVSLVMLSLVPVMSFASTSTTSLSTVPVNVTFKPNSVGGGEKTTVMITNKGSTTYMFNQGCMQITETVNGHTTHYPKVCDPLSSNIVVQPGKTVSNTMAFKCGKGMYTGYDEVSYVNTKSGYQSHSGKLSFHCP
jgi:hypothetical protein